MSHIGPVQIGDRIRAARQAAGMSTDEVGEELEICERTVRRYEYGETIPKRLHLYALSAVLEAQELLDGLRKRIGSRTVAGDKPASRKP
jgi:transcriptional regulator with XRE-family HTH domain